MQATRITRKDMRHGVLYLTTSSVKSKNYTFCTSCRRTLMVGELRAALLTSGSSTSLFCEQCIQPQARAMVEEYQRVKEGLLFLNPRLPFSDSNRLYVDTLFTLRAYAVPVEKETLAGDVYSPYLLRHKVAPCAVCGESKTVRGMVERTFYEGGRFTTTTVIDLLQNRVEMFELRTVCRDCAIEEVNELHTLAKDFLEQVTHLVKPNYRYFAGQLSFPTKGRIYFQRRKGSQKALTISNVERLRTCSDCGERFERNCVRISFDHTKNYLCMRCGTQTMLQTTVFEKGLDVLERFRNERCQLCPLSTRIRCVTKGITVPLSVLDESR